MANTTNLLKIQVEPRDRMSKGGIKSLRREGRLPASLSMKGEDSFSFIIRRDELVKAIGKHGRMAVFKLDLEGKIYPAMIKEIQYTPVTKDALHVTFQGVSLTEETKAEVVINAIGREDVQYKRLDFLQVLDTVTVTGLPEAIPNSIDIDVSKMEAGDIITIADVTFPKGIETDLEGDRVIFTVNHQRVAEVDVDEDADETTETAAEAEEAAEEKAEESEA